MGKWVPKHISLLFEILLKIASAFCVLRITDASGQFFTGANICNLFKKSACFLAREFEKSDYFLNLYLKDFLACYLTMQGCPKIWM